VLREDFFHGRPTLLLPLGDGFLVPFDGTAHGPLATETERAEQLPDMARMIADAELGLDHLGHAQRCRVAKRLRTCYQHGLQLSEPAGIQLGQAAGAAGLAKGSLAAFPVLPHPAAQRLAGDLQLAGDPSLRNALAEKLQGFHAAALQGVEVPSLAFGASHVSRFLRRTRLRKADILLCGIR
jgi:hypothetical protein